MALQISAVSPTLAEVIGSMPPIAFGVATASGTALTITVPQFSIVYGAIVQSTSTTTSGFTLTTSGNTFTATVGSGEVCNWIAFGKVRG